MFSFPSGEKRVKQLLFTQAMNCSYALDFYIVSINLHKIPDVLSEVLYVYKKMKNPLTKSIQQ